MKELIKQLVEAYGPSGQEGPVRAIIEGILRSKVDELRTDDMGNLIAVKHGSDSGPVVMIAAHMDEIGLIVTHIDKEGYLRFGRIGGVQRQTLVGSRVRFANGTAGVIGWENWLQDDDLPKWEELFIDVGATSADDIPVEIGDTAAFDRPLDDNGERLIAKSMDNRISCAVAMQALLEMQQTANEVYVVFTTQEEVGTRGAMVSAFGIEPDVALAVDVTPTGDTPESRHMPVVLGKGPAIKIMDSGLLAHPGVVRWMIRTAEELDIPYQREVLEHGSTDARAMQGSRAGVPAGCLSIPCRYVHTPSEMVDYGDVLDSVELLKTLLERPIALS